MAPAPDPAPAPAPAPAAAAAAGCFLPPSARLSPLSFGYWASGWLAGWVRTAPHRTGDLSVGNGRFLFIIIVIYECREGGGGETGTRSGDTVASACFFSLDRRQAELLVLVLVLLGDCPTSSKRQFTPFPLPPPLPPPPKDNLAKFGMRVTPK